MTSHNFFWLLTFNCCFCHVRTLKVVDWDNILTKSRLFILCFSSEFFLVTFYTKIKFLRKSWKKFFNFSCEFLENSTELCDCFASMFLSRFPMYSLKFPIAKGWSFNCQIGNFLFFLFFLRKKVVFVILTTFLNFIIRSLNTLKAN